MPPKTCVKSKPAATRIRIITRPINAARRVAGAGSDSRLRTVVDDLVRLTLRQRDAARARKDYAAADAIRDGLDKIGVVVEDTAEGPRWELKR